MESLLILKSFRLTHCMFLLVSLLLFSTRVVADEWIYTVKPGQSLEYFGTALDQFTVCNSFAATQ